ncbi:MAG: ATP-binding protein [Clostridiales bacterium]|nr:ATP-binding protein [Clostridiales bacterium]
MSLVQVVGATTQQEVWVASRERKFIINEILLVEDQLRNSPRGEVIETYSFNRYIPLATETNGLIDEQVLAGLKAVGYSVDEEEINIAKLRIIGEISTPIGVGKQVRLPDFQEVEDLLVSNYPDYALTLGTIRGTGNLLDDLPGELSDTMCIYEQNAGIMPQDGVPFIFDYKSMNEYPHIGIFGGSGSGKSFGLRVFLEEFMKKRVPVVVLDPHWEMDFSTSFKGLPQERARDFSGEYKLFVVGVDVGVDFTDLKAAELVSLLGSGESLSEPMSNAVFTLHENKDSYTSFSSKLYGLITVMENESILNQDSAAIDNPREKEKIDYLSKLAAKYKDRVGHLSSLKGIAWRLNALEREGVFTAGTSPVEGAVMDGRLSVVRGPVKLLQVYGAYLLDRLYRNRRDYQDARQKGEPAKWFPPFVFVTDEAHNFSMKGERDSYSKRVIRGISQEGRKYGVILCMATQRPALLDDTVTAQLNTKIIFRTVRVTDINVIKEETDIGSEEARRLPYLNSGNAFLSSAITGRTIPIKIRCACTQSPHTQNPFEELEQVYFQQENQFWNIIKDKLPFSTNALHLVLGTISDELGKLIDHDQLIEQMNKLEEDGKVYAEKNPFGTTFHRSS